MPILSAAVNKCRHLRRALRGIHGRICVFRGQSLFRSGEEKDALRFYDKALRLLGPEQSSWLASAHWGRGNCLFNLGQYEDAASAYSSHIVLHNCAAAHMNLGDAYSRLGDDRRALDSHLEAVEIDPKLADAWIALAGNYAALERYEDSLTALRTALELDERSAGAWLGVADVHRRMESFEEAISACRKVTAIDPTCGMAFSVLGEAQYQLDDATAALEALERAIELKPDPWADWAAKALCLSDLGRHEAALDAARFALGLNGTDPYCHFALAIAYLGLGQIEAAQAERVLLKRDKTPRGCHLADVLQANIEEETRGGRGNRE